jgi:cupin fold WbuC family metalloprotein
MQILDRQLLDRLSAQAKETPRRRKNHNLHPTDDAICHRLLNAIEPDSYIPPHRHLDPAKDESFVVLRGKLGIITFDEQGAVLQTSLAEAGGDVVAVDIPNGVFHTAVSLASGTVFFEAKAGPYQPLRDQEKAPWAPAEGAATATGYLANLKGLFCP